MSDERDGARRDSDADEKGDTDGEGNTGDAGEEADAFDAIDDPDADIDDPFAELGAGVGGDDFEEAGTVDADPTDFDTADVDADPASPDDSDLGSDPSSVGSAPDADIDDPFDDIGPADAGTDLDDAFERMDVGGAAEEDVWESLDADTGPGGATSISGESDTEHVVSKRTYCQQCPHFTPPPEVACTHEGTTILEAVGFDEFRVRNCPMISEEDPTFDSDA